MVVGGIFYVSLMELKAIFFTLEIYFTFFSGTPFLALLFKKESYFNASSMSFKKMLLTQRKAYLFKSGTPRTAFRTYAYYNFLRRLSKSSYLKQKIRFKIKYQACTERRPRRSIPKKKRYFNTSKILSNWR
jgi:hypothetical protein